MTEPTTALAGLATLARTVADIASASDAAKRNTLLIEFQQALIQTQGITATEQVRNASLVARNQELEAECARLRDWSTEKAQYKTTEVSEGIFVLVHQSSTLQLKRAEKYCANCFGKQQKSLLQFQSVEVGRKRSLVCGTCKTTLVFNSYLDERVQA